MTPEDLLALALQHKWVAVASVVIGLLVRASKSDTTFPFDIPPRLRVWAALGLGLGAGGLDKAIEGAGTTWFAALAWGVVAAMIAIVSHNAVIASLRGGKEIALPGMTKAGISPGSGNPPSIPVKPLSKAELDEVKAAEGESDKPS